MPTSRAATYTKLIAWYDALGIALLAAVLVLTRDEPGSGFALIAILSFSGYALVLGIPLALLAIALCRRSLSWAKLAGVGALTLLGPLATGGFILIVWWFLEL